jgi:probable HAF family extracellular repeat protein
VVGYFVESRGGPEQGFLYSHGTYTVLDFPGASNTVAEGINAKGQIVGDYIDSSGTHAFLDSGGTYTTIDPPGSILSEAFGFNAKGDVVGLYQDSSNINHGFLASPSAGPNNTPKVGLGVDTFVFAPNSGHDTNTMLDAIQHPQAELANLQHAAAETVSTHEAHDTITLPDVHAANLHANAFRLV